MIIFKSEAKNNNLSVSVCTTYDPNAECLFCIVIIKDDWPYHDIIGQVVWKGTQSVVQGLIIP